MQTLTIVATASGPGPSGVAIVRVSGPHARIVMQGLSGIVPPPRLAALRVLRDKAGDILDKALVFWFPAPASFTGEDVCEFHIHGGRAVIVGVIEECLTYDNVSLARPGDFTRRAFENGKMDLSAAEGLADLIDAETKAQRRQALRQMEGALAQEVQSWRDEIIDALVDAEGAIDFPDEDLPSGLSERASGRIAHLRDKLSRNLHESNRAIRIRNGFRVAIIGAPNAGKSSLLNALAHREAAIVSSIAGTTRDVVEVRLVLEGLIVWLADTAGLRATDDAIELMGVTRALAQARSADLRLGVIASQEERSALMSIMQEGDVWILAKADAIAWTATPHNELAVSSITGLGLEGLEALLISRAQIDLAASETAPLTRLRHREAVSATITALERTLNAHAHAPELIAEDLRLAVRALGQIIGRVDMDDVLDRLFSQFCIGK